MKTIKKKIHALQYFNRLNVTVILKIILYIFYEQSICLYFYELQKWLWLSIHAGICVSERLGCIKTCLIQVTNEKYGFLEIFMFEVVIKAYMFFIHYLDVYVQLYFYKLIYMQD